MTGRRLILMTFFASLLLHCCYDGAAGGGVCILMYTARSLVCIAAVMKRSHSVECASHLDSHNLPACLLCWRLVITVSGDHMVCVTGS